jgi:hypothetical protein
MKRFLRWLSIWGVPLVFGLACGRTACAGADSPGRISGTVRNPSGEPAAGVLVSVHPGHYPAQPDYAEVLTDKSGRYEMILHLNDPNRAWQGIVIPINCIMARDFRKNLAASLEFTRTPTNLDLKLQPGITLSGFVTDTKGVPVTNALVNLTFIFWTPPVAGSFEFGPQPLKVDAQGSFSIPALPQGPDYYFYDGITAPGYGSAFGHLAAQDAHTNHYEFPAFVLKRPDRKLAGQVVDSEKKPVAGVRVSLSGLGQPKRLQYTNTDGQGHFTFNELCEGSLHIGADFERPPGTYMRPIGNTGMVVQAGDTNLVLQLGQPFHAPNSFMPGSDAR